MRSSAEWKPSDSAAVFGRTSVSAELKQYMTGLAALTDKLSVEVAEQVAAEEAAPCVHILRADGADTGLAFHGVPGGHEFTSFVLGLYNAAGPGQALDAEAAAQIKAISEPVDMKILVSLSAPCARSWMTAAAEDRRRKRRCRAEPTGPEPLRGPEGKIQGHERALPGHQRRSGFLRKEECTAAAGPDS